MTALFLPLVLAQLEIPVIVRGALVHPTRLLVKVADAKAEDAILDSGLVIRDRIPQIGYVTIEIPPLQHEAMLRKVGRLPGVLSAQLDYAKELAFTPNDPQWTNQWHVRTITADLAWDRSFGSPVTVAIIDTGLETSHPDLAGNVWVNSDEIPNNGIDDDLNGRVDDRNGYDFVLLDPIPDDADGHGTACAGIVGAVTNNAVGVAGIAPNARLMGLKCTNAQGFLYDSYLMPAYVYGADNGARVFSMSFFSDRVSPGERVALDYAWNKGVLPVVAAGNSARVFPYYPAAYENAMAVAALDTNNNRAGFSNFGSWVDVAAPGVSLTTTAVGAAYTNGFSGTSGACPHIAGVATLLFGAKPTATNIDIRRVIEDTATATIQSPIGEYTNYGLANTRAAMDALLDNTSTGRSSVVRWVSPLTGVLSREKSNPRLLVNRIQGRGFQSPRNVEVFFDGKPVKIATRGRDFVDVAAPTGAGVLTVKVDGTLVGTVNMLPSKQVLYPMTDVNTRSATLTNGTYARLLSADGSFANCTRRTNDDRILLEGNFSRVQAKAGTPATVSIRRRYTSTGTSGSTETLALYNWSTASYPYGTFTTFSTLSAPTAWQTTTFQIPNIRDYIDDEGNVYFYLNTTNALSGAQLDVDWIQLSVGE